MRSRQSLLSTMSATSWALTSARSSVTAAGLYWVMETNEVPVQMKIAHRPRDGWAVGFVDRGCLGFVDRGCLGLGARFGGQICYP